MKKRLRKKLRRGEFQEMGFALSFQTPAGISNHDRDQLIADFMRDAIEAQDLAFGGGGGGGGDEPFRGFVALMARGAVTAAQHEHVRRWLAAEPRLVAPRIGPLVDSRYTREWWSTAPLDLQR